MHRLVLTIVAMFIALPWAAASEPEVKTSLERTRIYEGESVGYHVTISNVKDPPAPNLKSLEADFAVVPQNRNSFNRFEHQEVDGRVTKDGWHYEQRFNYQITPRRVGTIEIPAPTVEIDGRVYRGQPLTLQVRGADQQDTVRMTIRTSRETVYPTQPFAVTLSVAVKALPPPYADMNPVGPIVLAAIRSPPLLEIPWAGDEKLPKGLEPKMNWRQWLQSLENGGGGFSVNGINVIIGFDRRLLTFQPEPQRVRLADRSGKEADYWQFDFRREFVPKRIGRYSFGPANLHGAQVAEVVEGGHATTENVYAVAKPVVVEVRDVPAEGRPACYIDAVGTFRLSADLEPKKVKTGDPMTLALTLEGEGTLDSATPPELAKLPAVADHFKIYDATDQTRGKQRRFVYSIRPRDADIKEFPPIAAAYFDVDAGRYVTLQTEPIPIEVTKAVQLAGRDIVAGRLPSGGKEVELRQGGIFANIADPAQMVGEPIRPEHWLFGAGGLAGVYAALALGVGRWRRLHGDPALVRRRAALGQAKKQLRRAAADFAAGRTNEGADGVLAGLRGLVADMLGRPVAGMTSTDACRLLETCGAGPELVERLRGLLDACEAVRYGGSAGGSASLGRDAQRLLRPLHAALRKRSRHTPCADARNGGAA
jgi:hypothetical protein